MRKKYGLNVIALTDSQSGKISVNISPEYNFAEKDVITVVGEVKNIEKLVKDVK